MFKNNITSCFLQNHLTSEIKEEWEAEFLYSIPFLVILTIIEIDHLKVLLSIKRQEMRYTTPIRLTSAVIGIKSRWIMETQ